jgi:hypothetical protein
MDGSKLGDNYKLYVKVYEKGSSVLHVESKAIRRNTRLSGTDQAGIFVDSIALADTIADIANLQANLLITIPEVGKLRKRKLILDIWAIDTETSYSPSI